MKVCRYYRLRQDLTNQVIGYSVLWYQQYDHATKRSFIFTITSVHNFNLEGPIIFLTAPFSYKYRPCSALCMPNFNTLLHY